MNDSSASDSTAARPAADAGAVGDWCGPRRFPLLLAVLVFVPFEKVLLGFQTFAVRDFGIFSYPVAYFQRQSFWRGELPWWNPLDCCGLPFLAQFNTLSLYPPALIYLALPLAWALPFFCLLHVYFGGLGMYFLAARWTRARAGAAIAGVAFAFSGLTLNFLMWPSHVATFAWLPWVLLLTEAGWRDGGRKLVPAALAAALEILAGGPETILFTWLILAAIGVADCARGAVRPWPWARRFILMGLLALGLAAMQLLPFADFAAHCSRNTNYANSEWSMPAWGWANYLTPLFHTYRWQGLALQPDQYWTTSYYVGIGTVFLAAVALARRPGARARVLAGLAAASLVLALGDHAYVYPWLRRVFPFLGFFRFPIKFVIVTSALLPLLAAYAVAGLERRQAGGESDRSWAVEKWALGGAVVLVGVILWFAREDPQDTGLWPATLGNALWRLGFLGAFLGALYFYLTRPAHRRWSALLLPVICWLDLVTAVPWQNPTLNPSVYQPDLGRMTAGFKSEPDRAESRLMISSLSARQLYYHPPGDLKTAYLLDRSVFLADCNLLDDLPKVDGFFSLYLREPDKILWMLDGRTGAALDSLEDFLAVSETIATGKVYDWVARPHYVPIVTAGQQPVFADDASTLAAVGGTNTDFRAVVYLPPEAKSGITAQRQTAARIVNKQFGDSRETVEVESPGPEMVTISQAYYHNWQAEVDGRAVPIWRANYAFQAVEVPAGRHKVVLFYRDKMFRLGALLTAFAGLICVILGLLPRGKGHESAVNNSV